LDSQLLILSVKSLYFQRGLMWPDNYLRYIKVSYLL